MIAFEGFLDWEAEPLSLRFIVAAAFLTTIIWKIGGSS